MSKPDRPNEKTIVRRNFKAFQKRRGLPTANPFNRFVRPKKDEDLLKP